MAGEYRIRLYDTTGARFAELTDWVAMSYTKRQNGVGDYALTLDANDPAVALLEAYDAEGLDTIVQIWRRDRANGIDWAVDFEGCHRTAVYETLTDGGEHWQSLGPGLLHLLETRSIMYAAGSAGSDKSGPGETVIRNYVRENCGADATLANGRDFAAPALVTVAASSGTGAAWEGQRTRRNVLDTIAEIAKATGIDYAVVSGTLPDLLFIAKPTPYGTDRSTVGLNPATGRNAAGNSPTVFSTDFGNMATPRYSRQRSAEATVAYALGQGVGAARVVRQKVSPQAYVTPLNWREVVRNANQESTNAGLDAVADSLLDELKAQETFDFQVLQTPATLYQRDFALGDIVHARYRRFDADFQIVEVGVVATGGPEELRVVVGPPIGG